MNYLKSYKSFEGLKDNYLGFIHNRINHEDSMVIVAGSFRFYLEDNYPEKVDEYFYRISDGDNIVSVILDISKNMTRDGKVGEHLRSIIDDIFPKYKVICVANPEGFDIDIGDEYTVVDEYVEDGRELLELEYNSSGEPCTVYRKSFFI